MKLRIVGLGINSKNHATSEAIMHLNAAKKILTHGVSISNVKNLATANTINIIDLDHLYQDADIDTENYNRIKDVILQHLFEYKDICYVISGNPRLAVSLISMLEQVLAKESVEIIIVPGISSFDSMINDLKLDPLERGTCLIDANRLLLLDYSMEPKLNYFIYHICSIGNVRTNYSTPTYNNHFELLQRKLLKHFPTNHVIKMISSATDESGLLIKQDVVQNLPELLQVVNFDCTLFIPGVALVKSDIDLEFLNVLNHSAVG